MSKRPDWIHSEPGGFRCYRCGGLLVIRHERAELPPLPAGSMAATLPLSLEAFTALLGAFQAEHAGCPLPAEGGA